MTLTISLKRLVPLTLVLSMLLMAYGLVRAENPCEWEEQCCTEEGCFMMAAHDDDCKPLSGCINYDCSAIDRGPNTCWVTCYFMNCPCNWTSGLCLIVED
jgi:hypothetical protein